jgi:gliding motility-associated protein GldM
MAGYKETPRQKMIAMMYLVLTALLALNVSKQILDAFVLVNESMETTNVNFSKKLENSYDKFKMQYQLEPNKVGPYWEKAQVAHALSTKLVKYIDSLRTVIIFRTEGLKTMEEAKNISLQNVETKDNYDRPTHFFVGSSTDGSLGEAQHLRKKIDDYKKNLLDLVDPKYKNSMKIGLDTKGPFHDRDGLKEGWEMHNFYRTILAADVTILNNLKAQVFNAEFDVITNLMAAISAEDFKYNKITARVIPKSRYVFLGEEYQAEIVVAAYDTKATPIVRYSMGTDSLYERDYNRATPLEGSNGVVTLKLAASQEGLKKFAGIIKIISPMGDTIPFHFKDDYIVARAGLNITPTMMNVFYVGIDNPVDISVPGNPEKVMPTISVGSIRPEGKAWIVSNLPKGVKDATISVNAVFAGKTKSMGSTKFRLKTVPDPVVKVGGKSDGFIDKNLLLASPYVLCQMPAGFDFDIRYNVTSFTFVTVDAGDVHRIKVSAGNRFTPEIVKIIQSSGRNKPFWIESVNVKGPDERTITGISLKIN